VRLLDLFCGAGGAAMGYHRAGFTEIVGVDIKPQPRYPFSFVLGDALEYCAAHGREFDAIHASPPCQKFTQMSARWRGRGGVADSHPDLLTPTLMALRTLGIPWAVENVQGARPLMGRVVSLHGGMFGLGVYRPRLFASDLLILAPTALMPLEPIGVYGDRPDGRRLWTRLNGNGKKRSVMRCAKSLEEAQVAMGMDWADWHGTKEAIPPAYTEFIGKQLLRAVEKREEIA